MWSKINRLVFYIICLLAIGSNLADAHHVTSIKARESYKVFSDTSKLRKLLLNKKKQRIKELEKQMSTLAREREKQRVADSLAQKRAEEKNARIKELAKKADRDSIILKSLTNQNENISKTSKGLEALNSSLKPPPPALTFTELIENRFSAPASAAESSKDKQEKLRILRKIIKQDSVNLSESVTVHNRLEVKQIAEVWGFLKSAPINKIYDYNVINNLIYKSYVLNGQTGTISTSRPELYEIKHAQEAGCKITFAVNAGGQANAASFLSNKTAQRTFIYSTLELLAEKSADGIILDFGALNSAQRSNFIEFITDLSERYRSRSKKYKITITLPAIDSNNGYDLNTLDALADYFLVDFSYFQGKVTGDPIAPLNNQNPYNITSCLSRYLISKVDAYKFVLCLPYHGIKWDYSTKPVTVDKSIAYKTIRANYIDQVAVFNEATASNLINLKDAAGNDLNKLIWYDDQNSLGKKYELVLKMGIGGVALKYLEEGDGYTELTDELAYRFLQVDTVKEDTVQRQVKRTWWEETKHTLYLYRMGLEYPCESAYDRLDITLINRFNFLLAALCIAIAGFCVLKIKKHGTDWRYKKLTIVILISFVGLLIATVFMELFLDGDVPWFGLEPKKGSDAPCIPMPFRVLFLIITAGIILGTLLMRFLIFPLIRKEEKP